MDKREVIKELASHWMLGSDTRSHDYNEGISAGITILNKLAEPDKPVIPNFVAEWFEENKDNLDDAIFGYIIFWEERDTNSELYQWFAKSKNKPIETLVRMKDGYEVEKEPLYHVKLTVINETYYLIQTKTMSGETYTHLSVVKNNKHCRTWKNSFTEREIKEINEDLWAFAVPVEKRL